MEIVGGFAQTVSNKSIWFFETYISVKTKEICIKIEEKYHKILISFQAMKWFYRYSI